MTHRHFQRWGDAVPVRLRLAFWCPGKAHATLDLLLVGIGLPYSTHRRSRVSSDAVGGTGRHIYVNSRTATSHARD